MPDGVFEGVWSGHQAQVTTPDNRVFVLTMKTGIRGAVGSPCRVVVSGGHVSVSLVDDEDDQS